MKTTVIFHAGDYDGRFCEAIARKFLPDAEFIGWDFGDSALTVPEAGTIYVLDLPADQPFGLKLNGKSITLKAMDHGQFAKLMPRLIWIDHHKSAIESHPTNIPGYRIDGVAACRLAWQWFAHDIANNVMSDPAYLPQKLEYLNRSVSEPLAVRLAGEYDIFDQQKPDWQDILAFQFGLDAQEELNWSALLNPYHYGPIGQIIQQGKVAMRCYAKRDADMMRSRSFLLEWEGWKWLTLNTARCNSNTFAALDIPETGHDALMGFFFNGKVWTVSLYHAKHRTDLDLSAIAVNHGGGGHRGACGFTVDRLPFLV